MSNLIFRIDHGLKIKKTDLIILLVVLCTFEISYLSYISLAVKIFYLLCQSAIIAYGLLNIWAKRKYDGIDFLLLLYIALEFISTIANHEELKELILNTKTLLLLYVSFKWVFGLKPQIYLRLMSRYLLLITFLNTLSAIICYPRGLFYYDAFAPAFVIGADNTSTRIYIISIAFCFIDDVFSEAKTKKKLSAFPMISLVNFVVYVFLRDIGNGKMCAIVFVLAYFVFQMLKVPMISKPINKIILGNYILFFVMVVLNRLDIFSFIIVNVLHRDLTLTTRTTIWRISMDKIFEKPLFGNGYMSGEQFESMLPSIIGINAHNTILMVAFIGGLVLSVVFLLILINLTKLYDKRISDEKLWMLPVAFLALFLRSQVEGGDAVYLIAMAVLISSVAKSYTMLNNKTSLR